MVNRRWLAALLVLSLVANLLLIGVVVGRWGFGGASRPPPLAWALTELSPETTEKVQPALRQNLEQTKSIRRQLREVLREIDQLTRAESFNLKNWDEALATLRGVSASYQQEVHRTALEVLPSLSVAERKRLMKRLLRPQMPRGAPRPSRPSPDTREDH